MADPAPADSGPIVDVLTTIAGHTSRIADALEAIRDTHASMDETHSSILEKIVKIEEHQKTIRDLGEGDGIHWRRPSEWSGGSASFTSSVSGDAGTSTSQISIKNTG